MICQRRKAEGPQADEQGRQQKSRCMVGIPDSALELRFARVVEPRPLPRPAKLADVVGPRSRRVGDGQRAQIEHVGVGIPEVLEDGDLPRRSRKEVDCAVGVDADRVAAFDGLARAVLQGRPLGFSRDSVGALFSARTLSAHCRKRNPAARAGNTPAQFSAEFDRERPDSISNYIVHQQEKAFVQGQETREYECERQDCKDD